MMAKSRKPPYLEIFGLFLTLFPLAAVMALSKDTPWYQSLLLGMIAVFVIEFTLAAFIKGAIYGKLEKLIQSRIPDEMQAAYAEDETDARLGEIVLRMFSFGLFVMIYTGTALLADLAAYEFSKKIQMIFGIPVVSIAGIITFAISGIMAGVSLWLFAELKKNAVTRGALTGGLIGILLGVIRGIPVLNTPMIGKYVNGISIGFCAGIIIWFGLTLRAFARSGHSPVLGFLWIIVTGAFGAGLGLSAAGRFQQIIPAAVTVVSGFFLVLLIFVSRKFS